MKTFWSIVKLNYQMIIPKKFLFYFFLISGFTIGTLTFLLFTPLDQVKSNLHWFYLWILFATPGFASSLIYNEWNSKTHHWLLSLPYPRWWLIVCKYIAILLQILVVLIISSTVPYLTLYLYSLTDSVLSQNVGWANLLSDYFQLMLKDLVYFPFLITLGIFASTITYSPFRPLTGLVWLLFGLSCPFIVLQRIRNLANLDWGILQMNHSTLLLISFGLSILFFSGTNYLFKRKIQI